MRGRGRTVAIGVAVAAVVAVVAGAVAAGTRSSDESALQPARRAADRGIERKVNALLAKMTLEEKLQQIQLLSDGQVTDADARAGVGGVFSLTDPAKIDHLQRVAVEESRLGIPILFAYDTIHGYRTIFPIPLGAASSFDPAVATADATIGARETATVGIKQVYSPMVNLSHEPRWGRIAEGAGEDPYLGAVFAAARVKAAQGKSYSAPEKVVTSPKHLAAYGQPEGGRDYNTTDMSEQRLRNLYLPPFKAAIDAGADTVMCSFNAINGVPGCANSLLETEILKGEWGFDGFVESDYTAVAELRACPPRKPDEGPCGHGIAAMGPPPRGRAQRRDRLGDGDTNIRDFGPQLLAQRRISTSRIDDAVRRILRVKFRAGLFDHPYVDQAKAVNPASFVTAADRAAARAAAGKSMVLLKNDGVLPLDPAKRTAVIGPLGDDQHDMLGPWWGKGVDADVVSVLTGIRRRARARPSPRGARWSTRTRPTSRPPMNADRTPASRRRWRRRTRPTRSSSPSARPAGRAARPPRAADRPPRGPAAADRRDQGDREAVRGGALQRAPADPDRRRRLLAGDPRGLVPGRRGRQRGGRRALRVVNPGGKLPVSFPRVLGQVPIYYNHEPTGRPCDTGAKYNSRYRDLNSCDPLYPFGFGLSYTTFSIANLRLSKGRVAADGALTASVDVTNTGGRAGDEVVHSTSTTRWPASRSRCDACAGSSGWPWSRARPAPSASRSTGATSASTTTTATWSWSRAPSTSTPGTARPPT